MIARHQPVSAEAQQKYEADTERAATFDELLGQAQIAEQELRAVEAARAPAGDRYRLAKRLDAALTEAMRAAYAAERAAIGPRGYDDWIYRRKAKATPPVRRWTAEAERLLTLRESHRLTGIPRAPLVLAVEKEHAAGSVPAH